MPLVGKGGHTYWNLFHQQKAQPGEGTYADLGDFQAKRTAPVTLPPIKKPPTYEETNYAEITQFLKAPVAPQQDESPQEESALLEAPVEEPDENAKDDAWNNLNNDSAALSRDTKEETNTDKLYPSLELVKSENKTEQIVVSIWCFTIHGKQSFQVNF